VKTRLLALSGHPLTATLFRRGRTPGLRTARTTLAVVAAFLLAELLHTSDHPVLAPLTALLVVQLTLYETVAHGLGRIVSVLAGVLVAVGVANVVGLTWWSLGAVVAGSLVIGRILKLGPHLFEVPITAMLVLEVGGGERMAAGRVIETLLGAAVGVAVSALIAPPLYLQPAGDAIGDLAERMARFTRDFANGLRGEWSREAADHWLNGARRLGDDVAHADRALARAEDSARLNVRGRKAREVQPRLSTALTGLDHTYASLRSLCRALLDRTYFVPDEEQATAFDYRARHAIADVLESAAAAIQSVVPVVSGVDTAPDGRDAVDAHLVELKERRDRLSTLLRVDPHVDEGAWQQHGALLAAIDRLAVEVEAAVRLPEAEWRPEVISPRQRQAVRRLLGAALPRRSAERTFRHAAEQTGDRAADQATVETATPEATVDASVLASAVRRG
jgi:hypothetical protein